MYKEALQGHVGCDHCGLNELYGAVKCDAIGCCINPLVGGLKHFRRQDLVRDAHWRGALRGSRQNLA